MSNTADTSSDPGRWWPLRPASYQGSSEWRLDVVTLLAVIGESSMAEHSQTITASFLCLLPRILPAPQALLKPSRPPRMPETPAKMAGVYSGVVLDTVGFFATIIQPLDDLPPFAFKALEIKHRHQHKDGGRQETALFPGRTVMAGDAATATASGVETAGTNNGVRFAYEENGDPEQGGQDPKQGINRRRTLQEKATDYLSNPTLDSHKRPAVPVQLWSPVHILSVFSFILSAALLAMAIYWEDGPAILAVSFVSLASSIVGYASWWRPILMNLNHSNKVPPGDIVIRTREGAFVYIKCHEGITRELYFGTEECEYRVSEMTHRLLMGLGTMMLMISVVLLGNCRWNMQLFIGVSYIVLNGLYWTMSMLPKRHYWDLSRYEWSDITPDDAKDAYKDDYRSNEGREAVKSYTRTLWYVIRETKRTAWIIRSGATAATDQWKQWLAEAEREAKVGNRNWAAVARKDEIMMSDMDSDGQPDQAAQRAPLSEVQGRKGSVASPGSL